MKWDRNTICVVLYSLNFLKPVHVQNIHLLPQYTPNNVVKRGQVSECKTSIFKFAKFEKHWISRCQSHENTAWMTSLGIVQKPAWLHQHSQLLFLSRRLFNTSFMNRDIHPSFVQCFLACWKTCEYKQCGAAVVYNCYVLDHTHLLFFRVNNKS